MCQHMKKTWEIIKSPGAMALLALASFCFAIYQQFDVKKPEILVKTEAVSSVFSVLQPVGGLQVSYAGSDLRSSRQSLWVISAVISNDGATVIRKADYDEATPFSISILGGQIVEAPTITSENSYLQNNLKPRVISNRIIFSPIIFEPKDIFRLRILVLGPEGSIPSLKADAKIAGLQGIRYATPDAPNANKSTWQMITQADALWIQPIRFFVYMFGGLLSIGVMGLAINSIAIPFTTFSSWRAKKLRTKNVKDYRQGENMDWEDRALSEIYIEHGDAALGQIKNFIDKSNKRLALLEQVGHANNEGQLDEIIKQATPFFATQLRDELTKRGLLSFEGIRPKWVGGIQNALLNICTFLSLDLESIAKEAERRESQTMTVGPQHIQMQVNIPKNT